MTDQKQDAAPAITAPQVEAAPEGLPRITLPAARPVITTYLGVAAPADQPKDKE